MTPDESIQMALRRLSSLAEWNDALEAGKIDEEGWHQETTRILTKAYLAADNPRGQSGHIGHEEAHWEQARRLLVDAINESGTFLDTGCASGYLMECVQSWSAAKGLAIEPYGLDISRELADLARRRLPHWADRICIGNAMTWQPPQPFNFVQERLECVPPRRMPDLIQHLLRNVVSPGGRLIVGVYNEERDEIRNVPSIESIVDGWGFAIAGRTEHDHYRDGRLLYRALWIGKGR